MGCWNATCGVSQLPILAGEKIRVFILEPSMHSDRSPNMTCYSTDHYTPLGIPFVAEYNDYGSVENSVENYNTEILHKELASRAVLPRDKPFNVGDEVAYLKEPTYDDDQYHSNYFEIVKIDGDDITIRERHSADKTETVVPVSNLKHDNREDYYDDIGDLEQTIRYIERGVFEIAGCDYFNPKALAVPGLFYVRENVWQAMISDIEEEDTQYTWGYKSRKTMKKQITAFLKELKETLKEIDDEDAADPATAAISAVKLIHGMERMGGDKNRIGDMFRNSRDGFNATLYRETIIDAVRNGEMKLARKILEDAQDTSQFMSAMSQLRKMLRPQCGAGSQCVGADYHKALNDVVSTELDIITGYWGEEDE